MGDTRKPNEALQDGDAVTTEFSQGASETESDLQAMLAEAEAEAAEAEASAAAARAKVSAMLSQQEDPAAAVEEEGKRRRRGWPPRWPAVAKVVAGMVIVGSLVGSGLIVWQHHNASVRRQHANEFIETAKQGVVAMTSLDFTNVNDQLRSILDNATGAFRDDLATRADDFIKVAQTSKVIAKGTVTAAGVESMTDDSAVVLVVGSEQVTNAAGNQQPRTFRFRVTVTRDGDARKVSKLEYVL